MKRSVLIHAALALILSGLFFTTACVRHKAERKIGDIHTRSVEQVFDSHRDALLSTPGVVGAGIAKLDEKPCIVVMVREKSFDLENHVPKQLEGYAVVIEIVGELKAQERD